MPDLSYKLIPELAEFGECKELFGELPLTVLQKGSLDFRLDQGIIYQIELSNTGKGVLLRGSAKVSGTTECARCLESAGFSAEGEVQGYYILDPEPDDEKCSDDEVFVVGADGKIDLSIPIIAAVVCELPLVTLCKQDCAGLCPSCGQNLNDEDCDCAKEGDPTSPFATLKDFSVTG